MNNNEIRMKTFIKGKLNKSDGQMNILQIYRVSLHKILQNIITEKKFYLLRFKSIGQF